MSSSVMQYARLVGPATIFHRLGQCCDSVYREAGIAETDADCEGLVRSQTGIFFKSVAVSRHRRLQRYWRSVDVDSVVPELFGEGGRVSGQLYPIPQFRIRDRDRCVKRCGSGVRQHPSLHCFVLEKIARPESLPKLILCQSRCGFDEMSVLGALSPKLSHQLRKTIEGIEGARFKVIADVVKRGLPSRRYKTVDQQHGHSDTERCGCDSGRERTKLFTEDREKNDSGQRRDRSCDINGSPPKPCLPLIHAAQNTAKIRSVKFAEDAA